MLGTLALIGDLLPSGRAADGYVYQPPQKHQVLAKTGQMGLVGIQPAHSVNRHGVVAFIGQIRERADGPLINGIYTADIPGRILATITPSITRAFAAELGPGISINNSNEILTRRVAYENSPLGPITFSYLDRWALGSNIRITLEDGRPPVPFLPNTEFTGILGLCAHNNSGDYAFSALVGDASYFAVLANGSGMKAPFASGVPPQVILSDNDLGIMGLGSGANGSVTLFSLPAIFPLQRLANADNGFARVGNRPGLNDAGSLAVFSGNLATPRGNTRQQAAGPGIFACLLPEQRIIRLAGLHGDRHRAPGEFWDDNALPGRERDGEFADGEEEDIGLISAIDYDGAACVNNLGQVAFTAFDVQGRKCVFSCRLNRTHSVQEASDPFAVLTQGDTIDGLNGTVAELQLSDSLSDRDIPGDLIVWVRMSSGEEGLIGIRPRQVPIVFIPGIAGTSLHRPNDELWPTLQPGDLRELTLDPASVLPDIRPVDAIRTYAGSTVYQTFFQALPESLGAGEVVPLTDPAGNYALREDTGSGSPGLFVFPYDWRLSNAVNAARLRQYILAIRDLYPGTEVDLVCHSMGGLVAGRYLLDHGQASHVRRCVTIGSPLLGAVVAYKRVLEGDFYGVGLGIVDWVNNGAITEILKWFPGFHELLPSPAYFRLQSEGLFSELGWDYDHDGTDVEDWSEDDIQRYFDAQYPAPGQRPVSANRAFHTPAQDDWSGWSTGADFLHIVGVQSTRSTTIQVVASAVTIRDPRPPFLMRTERYLYERKGWGDGTVPFISAFRSTALLAPGSLTTIVRADGTFRITTEKDYRDAQAEHTGLTGSQRVRLGLSYFLRTGRRLWTDDAPVPAASPALAAPRPSPDRELLVLGPDDVWVTDPGGTGSTAEPGRGPVPPEGVTLGRGANLTQLIYPAEGAFSFHATNGPEARVIGMIELIRRNEGGEILTRTRFHDILLPPGADWTLRDAGNPPYELVIHDPSATGPVIMAPRYSVEGAWAADERPPGLTITRSCPDGRPALGLTGTDSGSGVEAIWYETAEGGSAAYTAPLDPFAAGSGRVRAFAVDKAGNRSALAEFSILPPVAVTPTNRGMRISWATTCWPLVLETAAELGSPTAWRPVDLVPSVSPSETAIEVPAVRQGYFRLRLLR